MALMTSFINYKSRFTDIEDKIYDMANSETEFKREFLFNYVSDIETLLASITKNDLTLKYIQSESRSDKNNLIDLFYALSYSNRNIMQLRYIDASGKESIRIDRDKTSPELIIAPENKMQDKKQRKYFKETALLMPNQFWHSNIDLNIEHGKIEEPLKPTFRVATPLLDKGQFKGIVIINLMFENTIRNLVHSDSFDIYLVDKAGEVIYHPENTKSWSKYFDGVENIYSILPVNISKILNHNTYKEEGVCSQSLGDLFKNNEGIRIILTPKSIIMKKMQEKNIISALLVALTVLIVSIPLSWVVSIIPSKLQSKLVNAYDKISQNAEIIDKYVMISTTDKNGIIKTVSSYFTDITGYAANDIVGKKHNLLKHPDTPIEIHKDMWDTIKTGKVWEGELKDLNKEGNDLWIHEFISPELNTEGQIKGFTSIAQDITDKKNIEKLSITDNLTGLYNRHKLEDVLSCEMARFERYNSNFSIILFDIDFFKKVNDNYGHLVGDDVLIHLANILKKNARLTDIVSRWGGEEFLIVAGETQLESACLFAEKLREIIANYPFPTVGEITISCGIAQYASKETASDFIIRADNALYKAKRSGRNRVIKG